MTDVEKSGQDSEKPASYHSCPSCGLPFNTAIVVCPNDGTVIKTNQSLRNSLLTRYEFLSEAGSGGAGVVYKAKQKSTGKLVAIKMVSLDQVNKESQARFQAEANACSRLVHDHLIKLIDYGIAESGQPYIILEYVDGIDLSELLKKAGGISLRTALEIAEQLVSGLQHAHAQDILHRDLKPGNIMITWNVGHPFVKIVDFSIAKLGEERPTPAAELMIFAEEKAAYGGTQRSITPLDPVREIVGTPAYMSPEQILGKVLDQRSDLYSFGCVLYQMLVGSPPYQGTNSVQTVYKQLNEEAPALSVAAPGRSFPPGIEKIVAKLLKKDPAQRYKTAGDLLDDLMREHALIIEKEKQAPVRKKAEVKQYKVGPKSFSGGLLIGAIVLILVGVLCACYLAWQAGESGKITQSPTKSGQKKLNSHKTAKRSAAASSTAAPGSTP
jgi:serine/threonine protein kinase